MSTKAILVIILGFLCNSAWSTVSNRAPDTPRAEDCQLGLGLVEGEKYEESLSYLNKCLKLRFPKGVTAYLLEERALAYSKVGQFELAIRDEIKSIALVPAEDVWPYVMLGSYYRSAKQYKLALDALTEAKKYDEDGPGTGPGMAVFYHTGWTLHNAGRYKEAVSAFTEGIPKQRDYGFVYFRRALAYEKLNMREEAMKDFEQAYKIIKLEHYDEMIRKKFDSLGWL